MENYVDILNMPKFRRVNDEKSHQNTDALIEPQNNSVQTEYALAVSELLAEISAPKEVTMAATAKLRRQPSAKFVYHRIKKIVADNTGETYRTRDVIYNYKKIAEDISQIGEEIENKPARWYRNIEEINLNGKYISDIMKDETEKILQPWQVTVLEASTGMGKTTFICEHVLKKIKESGKKAMLLSNRVCLNKSMKREICKALDVEYLIDRFSEEGINNDLRVIASCVYVVSYQQAAAMFFNGLVEDNYRNKYDPVNNFGFLQKLPNHVDMLVMDEAHWFVSDSNFSPINAFLFDTLMKKYPKAAKCFISATVPDDLLKEVNDYTGSIGEQSIKKIESINFRNIYGFDNPYAVSKALHYKISRDEEQKVHKLVEIENFSDLIPQIVDTAGPKSKWIMFMDSKAEAQKLRDEINKKLASDTDMPTAVFVSAESKASKGVDHDILQELIETNSFSCPVLLCSSVIDSGLSIKDDNVKHIALPPFAPDTFIQAYGRDRHRSVKKTVYLRRINQKDVGKYIGRAKRVLELQEAFAEKDWWKVNTQFADELGKSFMIMPDGSLKLNRFAVAYSRQSLEFFTKVREKLEEDRYCYLRLNAQWLNQPESSVWSIIDKNEEQFISFLEHYRTSYEDGMPKKVFDVFKKEFKENCLKWLMPVTEVRNDRPWHTDVISRTLEFNGLTQYTIEEKRKGAGGKDGMFYYIVKQENVT